MGAIEIVDRIKEEAKIEGEKIVRKAKEEAEKLLEEERAETEERKKNLIVIEERKAAEEKERIIRTARLNVRKKKWNADEEMLEKALGMAKEKIKSVKKEGFKGKKYSEILAGLIKNAAISISTGSGSLSGGELELIISEEDTSHVDKGILEKISNEIGANISLSVERIRVAGGVIVRRMDGRVEVNNTFEKRMERFSTHLRENMMKVLFKE